MAGKYLLSCGVGLSPALFQRRRNQPPHGSTRAAPARRSGTSTRAPARFGDASEREKGNRAAHSFRPLVGLVKLNWASPRCDGGRRA